jgi:hypothetical protein
MEEVKAITRLPFAHPIQDVSNRLLDLEQVIFNVQE